MALAPAAREVVATANAPAAIGPYSQAIKAGGFVFCSGAIPFDVKKNALCTGSITEQTTILTAAGSSLNKAVKVDVFLRDMNDFVEMNTEYAKWFTGAFPARCCVQVARLPKDVGVEIAVTALQ